MKKIVFTSDFDGTISLRDFYWIIIDKYLGKEYLDYYKKWQNKEIKDVDFLNMVFNNINKDLDIVIQDIYSIPIDFTAIDFINWWTENIGEFYIISAGCKYYIDILLEKYDIKNKVEVIANPGYYRDGGIFMVPDTGKEYYSEVFGVDKGKAVDMIREKSDFLFFAGDSRPDYHAAQVADFTFAKKDSQLAKMLRDEGFEFFEFEYFSEIRSKVDSILHDIIKTGGNNE